MLKIVLFLLAFTTSFVMLFLIRRNFIYLSYSLFWIGISIIILILGLFPGLNLHLAVYLGIKYYPIFPVIVAILLLFVRTLIQDIELSKKERRLRRLIQEIAILRAELNFLNDKNNTKECF